MKHILIILFFLLLTSPLFGQETGILYQYETSSGFVWKSFGDKDTQPKYKGQVENGKPNGQGTFTNPDGEKYVGEWKDGGKHGQRTYTYHHGFKYVGDGRRIKNTVKEHTLLLMETGLKGNGRMGNHGTSQYTTKTETS